MSASDPGHIGIAGHDQTDRSRPVSRASQLVPECLDGGHGHAPRGPPAALGGPRRGGNERHDPAVIGLARPGNLWVAECHLAAKEKARARGGTGERHDDRASRFHAEAESRKGRGRALRHGPIMPATPGEEKANYSWRNARIGSTRAARRAGR